VIGAKAKTIKAGGAFRLWTLAKSIAVRGGVDKTFLRQYLLNLGVSQASYYRWRNRAIRHRFIRDLKRRNYFILQSPDNVARDIGLENKGRAVHMPLAIVLDKKRWGSEITAGLYATFAMCSRETIKRLTGVSVRTQSRHDKKAGVLKRSNYKLIPTEKRFDLLQREVICMRKAGTPAFVSYRRGRKPIICIRLPDYRSCKYPISPMRWPARRAPLKGNFNGTATGRMFFGQNDSEVNWDQIGKKMENRFVKLSRSREALGELFHLEQSSQNSNYWRSFTYYG